MVGAQTVLNAAAKLRTSSQVAAGGKKSKNEYLQKMTISADAGEIIS
jgi:hypothetical protein